MNQSSIKETRLHEEKLLRPTSVFAPRLRFYGTRVAISFVSIFFALLIIEICFRFVHPLLNPKRGWNDRPRHYYLAEGVHDGPQLENTPLANLDSYNILTIGDSFTFAQGNQFDDSFPARLGRWLNLNHEQPKVEVYNWGVSGYSTVQELELLKKGLRIVHPNLVILEITLNDPEMEPYRATHRWLDKHGRVKLTSPIFSAWSSLGFVVGRLLNYQTRREYVDYYFHLFQDHESWSRFESALRSFKAITLENNVKLLVAVLPLFSHELNDHYPFRSIHEKVDTLLSQLQLPYVDLLKDFENIPPSRLQIDPGIDSHPDEIAQRIIAEGIYSKLRGSDLVPQTVIAKNTRRVR